MVARLSLCRCPLNLLKSLSLHDLACRSVAHLHDVHARLRRFQSATVDRIDSLNGGGMAGLRNTRRAFLREVARIGVGFPSLFLSCCGIGNPLSAHAYFRVASHALSNTSTKAMGLSHVRMSWARAMATSEATMGCRLV